MSKQTAEFSPSFSPLKELKENTGGIAITLLLFHKECKNRIRSLEKYFDREAND